MSDEDFTNIEWDLSGSFYSKTGKTGTSASEIQNLLELVDRPVRLPSGTLTT